MHQLVTERIAQAEERIAELVGFTAQLQRAVARLGLHTPDGACDEDCGCKSDPVRSVDGRDPIPLAGSGASVVACSLDPQLVGGRIDDWNAVLAAAESREAIPGGVRLALGPNVDIARVAELAAAEQSCCSFFTFTIGVGSAGMTLDVTGSDEAQDVIGPSSGRPHEKESRVESRP